MLTLVLARQSLSPSLKRLRWSLPEVAVEPCAPRSKEFAIRASQKHYLDQNAFELQHFV